MFYAQETIDGVNIIDLRDTSYFSLAYKLHDLRVSAKRTAKIITEEYLRRITYITVITRIPNSTAYYTHQECRIDGILHCEHAPAKIGPQSNIEWYYNGLLHRIGGPAYYNSGVNKEIRYYKHGLKHNEDGFAVLINGPATNFTDVKEYWIHGRQLSKTQFKKYIYQKNHPGVYTVTVHVPVHTGPSKLEYPMRLRKSHINSKKDYIRSKYKARQ